MNHDYHNIIGLINYCNILSKVAKLTQAQVVFINGLVPWRPDIQNGIPQNLETGFSEYTKSLLDYGNRDDSELIKFFSHLQQEFSTLDRDAWINIFDSFATNKIDYGTDGIHPGPNSHKYMAKKVSDYLNL